MTDRDRILLKKIYLNQKLLFDTVKELHISAPADLDSIHSMMRRGMVQTVADIFELTVPIGEDVLKQLPLNIAIIKQFRNTASHNYGQITSALAYACIIHCVDKQFMSVVEKLLDMDDDTRDNR